MDLEAFLRTPPSLHRPGGGELVQMGLAPEMLAFIAAHVDESSHTLETGAGMSTIVFAAKGSRHIAITPVKEEIALITRHCEEHGIATERVTFLCAPSEHALPSLQTESLDLVVIDGRHGFPAPFIDFFYTAGKLRIGGHLIVDDVQLSPSRYMRDLLAEQPEWQLVKELEHRSAVFEKLGEGSEWLDWADQPFVMRTSGVPTPLQVALQDLRRRDLGALAGRVRRTAGRLTAQRGDRSR